MTTTRVGPNGQVVIPKAVRDQLAIRPGDEVVVEAVDGEARVRRLPTGDVLLGLLEDGAGTADIEEEHRRELEREERKIAYWDERAGSDSGTRRLGDARAAEAQAGCPSRQGRDRRGIGGRLVDQPR